MTIITRVRNAKRKGERRSEANLVSVVWPLAFLSDPASNGWTHQVKEAEAKRKAERAAKFEEGRRLKQVKYGNLFCKPVQRASYYQSIFFDTLGNLVRGQQKTPPFFSRGSLSPVSLGHHVFDGDCLSQTLNVTIIAVHKDQIASTD